jgi:hypothetical protein
VAVDVNTTQVPSRLALGWKLAPFACTPAVLLEIRTTPAVLASTDVATTTTAPANASTATLPTSNRTRIEPPLTARP